MVIRATVPDSRTPLSARGFNYIAVGDTSPGDVVWTNSPPRFRRYEATVRVGSGSADWEAAGSAVLRWEIKTRSGFTVRPSLEQGGRVHSGDRHWVHGHLGPLVVREPVCVVAVIDQHDARAFSYGTLSGHPVSGEEAFIVRRLSDGDVSLTVRSISAPGQGIWRMLYPAVLVAQRLYRRRYFRALDTVASADGLSQGRSASA
jgi:uncharacterized protein (UPF0548 family)